MQPKNEKIKSGIADDIGFFVFLTQVDATFLSLFSSIR